MTGLKMLGFTARAREDAKEDLGLLGSRGGWNRLGKLRQSGFGAWDLRRGLEVGMREGEERRDWSLGILDGSHNGSSWGLCDGLAVQADKWMQPEGGPVPVPKLPP